MMYVYDIYLYKQKNNFTLKKPLEVNLFWKNSERKTLCSQVKHTRVFEIEKINYNND